MNALPDLTTYSLDTLRNLEVAAANSMRAWRATADNANRRADAYGQNLADIRTAIDRAKVNPNAPMTSDQRRALFAAFTEVFGHSDREPRLAFTRMVLNKSAMDEVSWSAHKFGALTYGQASKVLDALDLLNV